MRQRPIFRNILLLGTLMVFLFSSLAVASQSTIIETEGRAAMGDDKSKKQTEDAAMQEAKRNAMEYVATYIKSETQVKDYVLQKDLVDAYAKATVKILQVIESEWFKDPALGDSYRVKIKAEVIPDPKKIESNPGLSDDPLAPLQVKIWTDKPAYQEGQKIKVYLKGNKPFFARIIYKDAGGNMVQLLPNPFRKENYFNGGVMYELPSGDDRFELEVSPPFGNESIIIYASTAQLGEISVSDTGAGVYVVNTKPADVGYSTRGVNLKAKGISVVGKDNKNQTVPAAEFAEAQADLKSSK